MEQFSITPAGRGDIPFLGECRYAMFQTMHPETDYGGKKEAFLRACLDYFSEHSGDARLFSVCARSAAGPVGCGVIMFERRPPHLANFDNQFGYILNIFVLPEYRRRGLATRMMTVLQEEAVRRGVWRIGLMASEEGQNVYRRMGYVVKENYMEIKTP